MKKQIGLILLDQNDNYIVEGRLPKRPDFDKELLSTFLKGEIVSKKGHNTLPPSMQKIITISEDHTSYTFPVTIPEIAESDILIITRSLERGNGKRFRLDKFRKIIEIEKLEIWIKC